MGKVLMIVAQEGFRDEELFIPKEILEREGHSVKIASTSRTRASGVKGTVLAPDMALYETNSGFFDAFIIVGGPGSEALSEEEDLLKLIIEAAGKKKITAGICLGSLTLAKAGVLAGKNATILPDRKAINVLRGNAAIYVQQPVVVDGRVVTADGPQSAGRFGSEIAALLKGKPF